jgi:enamine deaminase RidA (YjgF/YER057c/UK114 family)
MAKHVVASDRLMVPIAHFSHAVRVGSTIHLGAAAGVDRTRRLAGTSVGVGDMPAQSEQLFANLRLALEALGGSWQDVVKVKTYIVDWRDLPVYDAVHARELGALHPAVAKIGTWGFPLPQILLETELVACVAGTERFGSGGSVRAEGLHYCTTTPVGEGSDARAQSEEALRSLAGTLDKAGLRLQDVVMLGVSLADVRALPAFDDALRRAFRPPYPARSVVGVPLARAGQLVELESVAAYGGGQAVGTAIPGVAASAGMIAGDWLFVSARTAGGESGVERQTRRAWEQLATTLEAAGMSLDDVVRTNNVLTDWRHYAGFNAGYGAFVTRPYPPRATVHAALADPGACVQIEAIAHRQGNSATVLEAAEPAGPSATLPIPDAR